eukprot:Skav224344  [mRNA]  locus=scaffold2411:110007:120745:- [translate_table: standard]
MPSAPLGTPQAAGDLDGFDAQLQRCFVARMELRMGLPATGGAWRRVALCLAGADYPRASRGLSDVLHLAPSDAAERLAKHAGANSTAGLAEILQELQQLGVAWYDGTGWACSWGGIVRGCLRELFRQDPSEMVLAIRAAVPKLSLRSHVLAEAAKLVEIQRPGHRAPRRLQERLYALPPESLTQLRTSCGAQHSSRGVSSARREGVLELHRRFFVENRGMEGINELIQARAQEGLQKDRLHMREHRAKLQRLEAEMEDKVDQVYGLPQE